MGNLACFDLMMVSTHSSKIVQSLHSRDVSPFLWKPPYLSWICTCSWPIGPRKENHDNSMSHPDSNCIVFPLLSNNCRATSSIGWLFWLLQWVHFRTLCGMAESNAMAIPSPSAIQFKTFWQSQVYICATCLEGEWKTPLKNSDQVTVSGVIKGLATTSATQHASSWQSNLSAKWRATWKWMKMDTLQARLM